MYSIFYFSSTPTTLSNRIENSKDFDEQETIFGRSEHQDDELFD